MEGYFLDTNLFVLLEVITTDIPLLTVDFGLYLAAIETGEERAVNFTPYRITTRACPDDWSIRRATSNRNFKGRLTSDALQENL